MTYGELVNNLRYLARVYSICENENMREYSLSIAAADAIENLDDICQHQADEIRELQKKLCEWCGVCSEGRRRPSDCEIIYPNRQPKDGEE